MLQLLKAFSIKQLGIGALVLLCLSIYYYQSYKISSLEEQLEDSILEGQGLKALVKAERVSCNTEKIIVKETEEKEEALRRLKEMEETIKAIKDNEKQLTEKNKVISKSLEALKKKENCVNNRLDEETTEALESIFNNNSKENNKQQGD